MTTSNANNSAYPVVVPQNWDEVRYGMTKREAFALAAMQGLLACSEPFVVPKGKDVVEMLTERAVIFADTLINTLSKPQP